MVNDPWIEHAGKEVTIVRTADKDGGGIDCWSKYNDKTRSEEHTSELQSQR